MDSKDDYNRFDREERDFNIRAFLAQYLRYWYIFAISLVLAFGLARYYNWYENPVFSVTAKLHVRDENAGREGLLRALDVDPAVKNIENEIEVIRSHAILAKTLNELEFDVSYYLVGDVKVSEVYKDCPFRVAGEQLDFRAYSVPFNFYIVDAEKFELSYEVDSRTYTFDGHFGDTLTTSLGVIAVSRRDNFVPHHFNDDTFSKRSYRVRFNTMSRNQNRYLSRLSVGLARPQSTILQVYLEDEVPAKALDFVNKLIEVYLEDDVAQKNKASAITRSFLDDQLADITRDLESIEVNRERYKVTRGIIDLESEAQMVLESIREFDEKRAMNNARVAMINQLEAYVTENADLRDLAPSALDITDPLLIRLINKLSELQGQRQITLNTGTANDPMLTPLNAEIELTRASLLENIRNSRKGLLRKDQELNEEIRNLNSRMQRIPTTERELLEIERRRRIQEGLYTFLLQKRAELSISLAAAESDTRLVDSARLHPAPVSPVPQKAYSIALLLGLLIPAGAVFLAEKLRDKITDVNVLKRITSIPILGVVRLSTHEGALVTVEKPNSPVTEEYRNIRANLRFFAPDTESEVIMVTSSVGTEGKTFTAMNLACVLASGGSKTVLVGLDLRKPRIVGDFGLSNELGCSNFLSGNAELDEVILPSDESGNLSVVPAGPVPPNPSELIISDRMDEMIEGLKKRFDKVVIDTPPVGLVSDGLIISKYAAVTLFIVRYGVTRKHHIKHIEELYEKGQLSRLAIIFNAVRPRRSGYGYGTGYGYGYGYGYGSEYGKYFDDDSESEGSWLNKLKPTRKK